MAFDRTDPADLAALQTEVSTDPISMGYDPAGGTNQLLKLLNDPANNVGGDQSFRPFDYSALMDALDPTDFEAQQTVAGAATYSHMLLEISAYADISTYKTKWRSMFAGNSNTVTALDAQVVDLSRAEVLFGQGTVITRAMIGEKKPGTGIPAARLDEFVGRKAAREIAADYLLTEDDFE